MRNKNINFKNGSKNLRNCFHKIELIAGIKNKKLREQIANDFCDDCLYKAIHEIALNTVNGNIKVKSGKTLKKLKHNKKLILKLSKRVKGKLARKKLVVQSGGFLQFILPALISALGGVITNAANR